MQKHVTVLGLLYLGFGLLGCLAALFVMVVIAGGGILSRDPFALGVTSAVAMAIGGFLLLLSLPAVIGGAGLLRRASWSRMVVLILGVMNLINIPFGTAVGIYTMWVLLSDATTPLFRRPLTPLPF